MLAKGIILEPIVEGEIVKFQKDELPHFMERTCRLVGIRKGIFVLKDLAAENILEARPEDINWEEYRKRRWP